MHNGGTQYQDKTTQCENFDLNIPTWGPGSVGTPAVEELSPSWTFTSSSLMTVNIMCGVCVLCV